MKEFTSCKTLKNIRHTANNESGIILPYVLTLMMFASSYILMTWQEEQERLRHIQLINKQESTQNLIQISLHEFSLVLDTLDLNKEEQELIFNYNTGKVNVSYYLLTNNTLRIELEVFLKDTNQEPYKHTTVWNV